MKFNHGNSFYESVGITQDQMAGGAHKLATALTQTMKVGTRSESIEILYNAAMADEAVLLHILLKFYEWAMEGLSMNREKAASLMKELVDSIPPELKEKLGIVGAVMLTKKGGKVVGREVVGDIPEDEMEIVDALIAKHKEEMGCEGDCEHCEGHGDKEEKN